MPSAAALHIEDQEAPKKSGTLAGRRFYEPKDIGTEAEIRARLERMRAARKK